jgi:tetratricopeptide (TPR) repeat protein
MKKIMILALMVASTSCAFAQDPVKDMNKAKTFEDAQAILKSNIGSMSDEQKAKAYNTLVDKSMEKVQKEQATMSANQVAEQLKTGKVEPYDTLGFYNAVMNSFKSAIECDKYDQKPNEKGKIKPKFRSSNQTRLFPIRVNLINGGQASAQKNKNKEAGEQYAMYVDSYTLPLFDGVDKSKGDQYLGEVARVAAIYACQDSDYAKANRYIDVALKDTASAKSAMDLKLYIMQTQLKTKADSLNYVKELEGIYAKDTKNERIFGLLGGMYSSLGMNDKFNTCINERLAADPKDKMALELRGQTNMNAKKWDAAIADYKKAVEVDPENVIVLTYLGYTINSKANEMNDKLANKNGMLSAENMAKVKALFQESMGYLEKARDLDPNREKANWSYPLFGCYYIVYGANNPKTKEIEALTKQ